MAKNEYDFEDVKDIKIEDLVQFNIDFDKIIEDRSLSGIDLNQVVTVADLGSLLDVNSFFQIVGMITDEIKGGHAKSDVNAKVTIGNGAKITADENINIKSTAISQTTMKTEAKTLAASVGQNNSSSKIEIGAAQLSAVKDVNIKAQSTINSDIETKTGGENGEGFSGNAMTAVSVVKNETSVKVGTGSQIDAGNDINIESLTNKTVSVSADASVTGSNNENVGVAVIYGSSETDNSVTVNGSINAGNNININSEIKSENMLKTAKNSINAEDDANTAIATAILAEKEAVAAEKNALSAQEEALNAKEKVKTAKEELDKAGELLQEAVGGADVKQIAEAFNNYEKASLAYSDATDASDKAQTEAAKYGKVSSEDTLKRKAADEAKVLSQQKQAAADTANRELAISGLVIFDDNTDNSKILIGRDSIISALSADVAITAKSDTKTDIAAKTGSIDFGGISANAITVFSVMDNKSIIDIEKGSHIKAGKDAKINSLTSQSLTISADAPKTEESLNIGAAVVYSDSKSRSEINAAGNIEAGENINIESIAENSKNIKTAMLVLQREAAVEKAKTDTEAAKTEAGNAKTVSQQAESAVVEAEIALKQANGEFDAARQAEVDAVRAISQDIKSLFENYETLELEAVKSAAEAEAAKIALQKAIAFGTALDIEAAANKFNEAAAHAQSAKEIAQNAKDTVENAVNTAAGLEEKVAAYKAAVENTKQVKEKSALSAEAVKQAHETAKQAKIDSEIAKAVAEYYETGAIKEAEERVVKANKELAVTIAVIYDNNNTVSKVNAGYSGENAAKFTAAKSLDIKSEAISSSDINAKGTSFGVAVKNNSVTSKASAANALLTSSGNGENDALSLNAITKINNNLLAHSDTLQSDTDINLGATAAINILKTDTSVQLLEGAKINSAGNTHIKAFTEKDMSTLAKANSSLGIAVGLTESETKNTVNIYEDIKAKGNINIESAINVKKNETGSEIESYIAGGGQESESEEAKNKRIENEKKLKDIASGASEQAMSTAEEKKGTIEDIVQQSENEDMFLADDKTSGQAKGLIENLSITGAAAYSQNYENAEIVIGKSAKKVVLSGNDVNINTVIASIGETNEGQILSEANIITKSESAGAAASIAKNTIKAKTVLENADIEARNDADISSIIKINSDTQSSAGKVIFGESFEGGAAVTMSTVKTDAEVKLVNDNTIIKAVAGNVKISAETQKSVIAKSKADTGEQGNVAVSLTISDSESVNSVNIASDLYAGKDIEIKSYIGTEVGGITSEARAGVKTQKDQLAENKRKAQELLAVEFELELKKELAAQAETMLNDAKELGTVEDKKAAEENFAKAKEEVKKAEQDLSIKDEQLNPEKAVNRLEQELSVKKMAQEKAQQEMDLAIIEGNEGKINAAKVSLSKANDETKSVQKELNAWENVVESEKIKDIDHSAVAAAVIYADNIEKSAINIKKAQENVSPLKISAGSDIIINSKVKKISTVSTQADGAAASIANNRTSSFVDIKNTEIKTEGKQGGNVKINAVSDITANINSSAESFNVKEFGGSASASVSDLKSVTYVNLSEGTKIMDVGHGIENEKQASVTINANTVKALSVNAQTNMGENANVGLAAAVSLSESKNAVNIGSDISAGDISAGDISAGGNVDIGSVINIVKNDVKASALTDGAATSESEEDINKDKLETMVNDGSKKGTTTADEKRQSDGGSLGTGTKASSQGKESVKELQLTGVVTYAENIEKASINIKNADITAKEVNVNVAAAKVNETAVYESAQYISKAESAGAAVAIAKNTVYTSGIFDNVNINASNDINVNSTAKVKSDTQAIAGKLVFGGAFEGGAAVTVSAVKTDNTIQFCADDTFLDSGASIKIKAETEKEVIAKADTKTGQNGNIGISVTVSDSDSTNKVNIESDLYAAKDIEIISTINTDKNKKGDSANISAEASVGISEAKKHIRKYSGEREALKPFEDKLAKAQTLADEAKTLWQQAAVSGKEQALENYDKAKAELTKAEDALWEKQKELDPQFYAVIEAERQASKNYDDKHTTAEIAYEKYDHALNNPEGFTAQEIAQMKETAYLTRTEMRAAEKEWKIKNELSLSAQASAQKEYEQSTAAASSLAVAASVVYADNTDESVVNIKKSGENPNSLEVNAGANVTIDSFVNKKSHVSTTADGIAASIANNKTVSNVNINNTQITSKGKTGDSVKINASSDINAAIKSDAHSFNIKSFEGSAAASVSDLKSETKVNIINGSSITDLGNEGVKQTDTIISVNTAKKVLVTADTAMTKDTNLGVGVAVSLSETENVANINADINSGKDVLVNASVSSDSNVFAVTLKNEEENSEAQSPSQAKLDQEKQSEDSAHEAVNVSGKITDNITQGEKNDLPQADTKDAKKNISIAGTTVYTENKEISSVNFNGSILAGNNVAIKSGVWQNSTAQSEAAGVAVTIAENIANSSLNTSGTISAGNNADINSEVNINAALQSVSGSLTLGGSFEGGAATTISTVKSNALINSASQINAGNDIKIKAATSKELSVLADAKAGKTSNVGVGAVYSSSEANNEIKISQDLNAGANIIVDLAISVEKSDITALASVGEIKDKTDSLSNARIETAQAQNTYDSATAAKESAKKELDKAKIELNPEKIAKAQEAYNKAGEAQKTAETVLTAKKEVQDKAKAELEGIADRDLSIGAAVVYADNKDRSNINIQKAGDNLLNLTAGESVTVSSLVDKSAVVKTKADGIAVSIANNKTDSNINLSKVAITAFGVQNDDGVNLKADSKISSETLSETGSFNIKKFEGSAGAAISDVWGSTSVNMLKGSSVSAKNDVSVSAFTQKDIKVEVETKPGDDANIGLGFAYNKSETENKVNIYGNISAARDLSITSGIGAPSAKGAPSANVNNSTKVFASSGEIIEDDNNGQNKSVQAGGAVIYAANTEQSIINIGDEIIKDSDGNIVTVIENDVLLASGKDLNIKNTITKNVSASSEGAGAAVTIVENSSKADITALNADFKAAGNANIESVSDLKYYSGANSGTMTIKKFDGGIAAAVSTINNDNLIKLSGTNITAGKKVSVKAITTKEVSVQANALTGKTSNAGVGIGYSSFKTNNDIIVDGGNFKAADISFDSEIDSKNNNLKVTASTGNEEPKSSSAGSSSEGSSSGGSGNSGEPQSGNGSSDSIISKLVDFKTGGLEEIISSEKTDKNSGMQDSQNKNKVSIAGAVGYSEHNNKANVKITNAELKAVENINVASKITDANIKNDIEAAVRNASKVSGTGAVMYGIYSDHADAYIKDSSVDAGKNINVLSEQVIPVKGEEWLNEFPTSTSDMDSLQQLGKTASDKVKDDINGVNENIVNTWVRSAAAGEGGEGTSVSGAVNFTRFDLGANAYISESDINQDTAYRSGNQNVAVNALSESVFVNVGGVLGESYKTPLGQGGSAVGIGGTYNQITYQADTNAYIKGKNLYANDLFVNASNEQTDITVGVAGGESSKFALQGVFNLIDSENNVNAYISNADKIEIIKTDANNGTTTVNAAHKDLLVNVAGSVSASNKVAVGISAAVMRAARNTNAHIKDVNNFKTAKTDISAVNDGIIHSYSVAAGVIGESSSSQENKEQVDNPDSSNYFDKEGGQSGGTGDSGSFGLGISGSASINDINGLAKANIENTKMESEGDIGINAQEKSAIISGSGAVALTLQSEGTGISIGGAAGVNLINNNTKAYISGSEIISKGKISLDAQNESSTIAVAAGLAGSTEKNGASIAGSASVNITGNETSAYIDNSLISAKKDLSLNSQDASQIISLAGAAAFGTTTVAVGSSVGVNLLNNSIYSKINNSDINISSNKLSLVSSNKSLIQTLGITAGVTNATLGAAVSVIVNNIGNTTEAAITGKKENDGKIESGDINVKASDKSKMEGAAGTVAGAGKVGIGVGVGVNEIGNTVKTYIKDADIKSSQNVTSEALSDSSIHFAVAGIGVGGSVGVVGGVGINNVKNETEARIDNSSIAAGGSIGVLAKNADEITFIIGALGIGGTAGVAGNVGLNFTSNKAIAEINNSKIDALGNKVLENSGKKWGNNDLYGVAVKADIYEKMSIYNAAASGAGSAAVSGGYTQNSIKNKSKASISNSEINKENNLVLAGANQGVYVKATNEADISSYGGAVAGAGMVGVGVAVNMLEMANEIEASITGSTVKAKGDIEVITDNIEKYDALVVAGAGAGGVAVAGSVAVADIDSKNNALVSQSNLNGANIDVRAKDEVLLGNGDLGIAVGAAAGAAIAGIAGGIFTGFVSNQTSAQVLNSAIEASKTFNLEAQSAQKIKSSMASIGGAVVAGIGLSFALTAVNTQTKALADGNTIIDAQEDIKINAENKFELKQDILAVGGAAWVGVGASVSVTNINNDVASGLGDNVKAEAGNDISVTAESEKDITEHVLSNAGGFVGASGSVAVLTAGGNIGNGSNESKENTGGYVNDMNSMMSQSGNYNEANAGNGGLTAKYIVDMKNGDKNADIIFKPTEIKNGTSAFIGKNAQVTAGSDINVTATDKFKLDSIAGGVSGGFVGIGASVNIANITTAANAYVDNNSILRAKNNINIVSNNNADAKMHTFIGSFGVAAVNAAVNILAIRNDSYAKIKNNVQILKANDINILANSKSRIDNEIDRATIGVVGTGATVATIKKDGTTEASIGDNVKIRSVESEEKTIYEIINNVIGTDPETGDDIYETTIIPHTEIVEVESGAGSLTVKASNDNSIKTSSISGAVGVLSASVNIFNTNINDNINAFTGKNTDILLNNDMLVATDGKIKAESKFLGVTLGLVAIGVADTNLNINIENHAYLGENGTIEAENVSVGANQNTEVDASMQGFAVSAVKYDINNINTSIEGNIDSTIKQGNNILAGSGIFTEAKSASNQNLKTLSLAGSLVSAGLTRLQAETALNIKSQLGDKLNLNADIVKLKTDNDNKIYAYAESGAAGVYSDGGSDVKTINNSTNKVNIGTENSEENTNIITGTFEIEAENISNLNGNIKTGSINLAENAKSTIKNTSNSLLDINIQGKTKILANHINITSLNNFIKENVGKNINSKSVSLIGGIFETSSKTNISNATNINFGKHTYLKTFKADNKQSLFFIDAASNVQAYDRAFFASAAGFGSDSKVVSEINNTSSQAINFNGEIISAADLIVNARADINTDSRTDASAAGFVTAITGVSESYNTLNNTININKGAELFSNGEVYMYMSNTQDAASFFSSRAYTGINLVAAIPWGADSVGKSRITINDRFNIAKDGALKAIGSIEVNANPHGLASGEGLLEVKSLSAIVPIKESNYGFGFNRNSYTQIDGEMRAGVNTEVKINILGDYIDGENANLRVDVYKNAGEAVEHADIEYMVTSENLENNLLEQRETLYTLLTQYYGSDSESYIRNQIERVEEELVKLDLMELDAESGERMLRERDIDYLTFGNITAGMGEIRIKTNNLSGNGKLSASDNAVIIIDNNSGYNLRFNDIEIISSEGAGRIMMNDVEMKTVEDIKKQNRNKSLGVNFEEYSLGTGANLSGILINSNYSFLEMDPYIKPMVELTGDVTNSKGLVQISAQGNIVTMGRLIGDNVKIVSTEGNIVQSFIGVKGKNGGSYVYHPGGLPSNDWKDVAQSNADGYANQHHSQSPWTGEKSSDMPVAELKKSEIIGNNVYISGEYLDINGLVQAGVADWDLNIANNNIKVVIYTKIVDGNEVAKTGTINEALAYYNSMQNAVKSISPSFELVKDQHGNAPAYYNVKTQEIEMQNIYVEGGKLELYGRILNTSTSGKGELKALDGYARANIVNNSDYKINIKNIDTSNKVEGMIKITDKGKEGAEGKSLETVYTFNGADIVKRDNLTVDGEGNGNNIEIVSGKDTSYMPKEGQRYVWTTGTEQTDRKTYRKRSRKFIRIGSGDDLDSKYSVINYERLNYNKLFEFERVEDGAVTDPHYKYTYQRHFTGKNDIVNTWTDKKDVGWPKWGYYVEHTRYVVTERGIKNFNTNSIKADNAIKVGFIGYVSAQNMKINSKADINLKGTLNAGAADVLLASQKSIDSSGAGKAAGKNVMIDAVNGIGNTNAINVNLFGGAISAQNSVKGNINISAKNSLNAGDTMVGKIVNNGNGKVVLNSDKEIRGKDENSVIKGKSVEVNSNLGGISGFENGALEIDTELIKATAYGDINLIKKANGDLGVYKIESLSGDVSVETKQGSISDKSEMVERFEEESMEEKMERWTELGLFEQGWTVEKLTNAITIKEESQTKEATISGNNIMLKSSVDIGKIEEGFSFKASEWEGLTLGEKEKAAKAVNVSISGSGADAVIQITQNEQIYVYAKEGVKAEAAGDINLGSGKELNVKEIKAGKNIMISGVEGMFNTASNKEINVSGVNVNIRSALEDIGAVEKYLTVDVSGNLTAFAKKNIYIKSEKDLALNAVEAGKEAMLDIDGNLTNSNLNIEAANITAHKINVEAENIGTRDNNISVMLKKDDSVEEESEINLEASDSLYINNTAKSDGNPEPTASHPELVSGAALNIGTIKAAKNAVINSEHGDIIGFDETAVINAKNIELNAKEGNIGSEDNKVQVSGFDLVSGHANKDINVSAVDNTFGHPELVSGSVFNFGNMISETGNINISVAEGGANVVGVIEAAEKVNVNVDGSITDDRGLLSDFIKQNDSPVIVNSVEEQGFYGKEIELNTKEGSIGSKEDSIRIGGSPYGIADPSNPGDPDPGNPGDPEVPTTPVIGEGSDQESKLNATGEKGIYLESHDTVVAEKVITNKGDIKLETEGSIKAQKQINEESNFKADNITLHAKGHIGEKDNRVITKPLKEKGMVNLKANGEIYVKQNGQNRFYSEYVINMGKGATSLLLPDNHVFIVKLDIGNAKLFKIDFTGRKYKKEINIGYNDMKKLAIHPVAVQTNKDEEEMESKYELLKGFEKNIELSPALFLLPGQQLILPMMPVTKGSSDKNIEISKR